MNAANLPGQYHPMDSALMRLADEGKRDHDSRFRLFFTTALSYLIFQWFNSQKERESRDSCSCHGASQGHAQKRAVITVLDKHVIYDNRHENGLQIKYLENKEDLSTCTPKKTFISDGVQVTIYLGNWISVN